MLIDKLEGAKIGEILFLDGTKSSAVGYLCNLKRKNVTLSTELPFGLQDDDRIDRVSFFGSGPTKFFSDSLKYNLENYDRFEILKPVRKHEINEGLEGVNEGDIILLDLVRSDGDGYSAVGYLNSLENNFIKLSTTFSKSNNNRKNSGILKEFLTKVRKYSLDHFRTYEVLKSYK